MERKLAGSMEMRSSLGETRVLSSLVFRRWRKAIHLALVL